DSREMHENIFTSLPADKAEALGVVKPFHCSLFHCLFLISLLNFLLRRIAATERGDAETRNQLSTAWNQTELDTNWMSDPGERFTNSLLIPSQETRGQKRVDGPD